MNIKVYVETDKVGSRVEEVIEIADEELEGLEPSEVDQYLEDYVMDWMFEQIDWGYDCFGDGEDKEEDV